MNRREKGQKTYFQKNQEMCYGAGTLQSKRPGRPGQGLQDKSQCIRPWWPDQMHRGMAPDFNPSSMAEHGQQDLKSSQPGEMSPSPSCKLFSSFSPPFSRTGENKGQRLPRQCNGCNRRAVSGKHNPGMGFFSGNCKQSAEHMGQAPEASRPFHGRLRNHIKWWEKHSSKEVLTLIKYGVTAAAPLPPRLTCKPCIRSRQETAMALEALTDYISVGAVKEIPPSHARHLIPWFVIKKGEKLRLITDCREINRYLEPKPFKLENWQEIFPYLKKGMWAAKIDLKHAYFHLGIADTLKKYICIQVEENVFQFQGTCFGMRTLPQQWQSVMKVFLKKWRSQGFQCWIYLDDILLVANSPQVVSTQLGKMVEDLKTSGMVINEKKSQLTPTQEVNHLGFTVDFKQGSLQVPQEKLKAVRKELGKLLTHSEMSCRKMSAILGATRSFLMAMPFLRAFTDQLVQFVKQQEILGWDHKVSIPPF